ncbi:MAG: hypothetical protein GC154_03620 [bacterium]|nr:hypothetical protein [bacterium]
MRIRHLWLYMGMVALLAAAFTPAVHSAVQYQNNFDNPSSEIVSEAYPEWIDFGGNSARAKNGRIEWYDSGDNNDWYRLDRELPNEYSFEFDFYFQAGVNGRFSVWPACKPGESIFERHNYFIRANTHYFNGSDTIPSEGPRDLTLPLGSKPHRLRFEVSGDHVVFLYKDRGEGGWILVDERDFPAFGDGPRYLQLGYNHDSGTAGVHWIDNFVLNYRDENLFSYSNNFDNPSSNIPNTAWPEWVDFGGNTARAANNRLEWYDSGGNDDWLRLDKELPMNFVMEFDFFHPADVNARFSVWPLVKPGEGIFERHNYFLRANTHYFNGGDTIPSEGPRDLTLPPGSPPHRLRFEVTGDHVVFLYKDRGQGGWILIDERDFPPFGDGPRYVQLGSNHDSGTAGVHWVDNFQITGLSDNRATVDRAFGADNFEANTPVPVSLFTTVTGSLPSVTVTESIPEGWEVSDISDGGVVSGGNIVWSFTNLSESKKLTYNAIPPRLIRSRTVNFAGSVDSGDGDERITGETLLTIVLPYLYREAIDYDFSGSPVDGKNYPTGTDFGVRYAEGMDGVPSDVAYTRPTGDNSKPAIDAAFTFPAGTDFHQGNPDYNRGEEGYHFEEYRDQGEVQPQHGANETHASMGSLDPGDWFRYTFDLGEGDQVLIVNAEFNTWGLGDSVVDLYVDNKYKGEYNIAGQSFNAFHFGTVGPFEVTGGVHSLVFAFPTGLVVPADIGRIEVVRVKGIGRVERTLTDNGFFNPGQAFDVSLNATALYGSYTPYIEEDVPVGATITNISNGGQVVGDKIIWDLAATQTSQSLSYHLAPPPGVRYLLFSGLCDIGLPLADTIKGDSSVVNELWLFGESTSDKTDEFTAASLGSPWKIEYGSDPALTVDYTEGVNIRVEDGALLLGADALGDAARLDEYANGRRAPMVLRTDVPAGDWRIEAEVTLIDALDWTNFSTGIVVSYNDGADTDVSGDEYLFGFYAANIQVEKTNLGAIGQLSYQEYTDVLDWYDLLDNGAITAKLAVTRRGNDLAFSAQLPGRSWQLLGGAAAEPRQATRVGFYTKIFGADTYTETRFDYFTLSALNVFTDVEMWELY